MDYCIRALTNEVVDSVADADIEIERLLQDFPSIAFDRKEPEPGENENG